MIRRDGTPKVTMQFTAPDPQRYRISDCGRYIIEKINLGNKPVYCVWSYSTQAGGYDSFEEARAGIMEREYQRWFQAPEVGTVALCPVCGRPDGAVVAPPREALEGDIGL